MSKKSLLSLLFTAICLAGCGGSNGGSNDTREKLYVGLECNYAPFNWTDPAKNDFNYQISGTNTYADGYDVQMAKKIADELDMELVIKKIEWDGLIPSCLEGTIDLIIAGMSPTEERKIEVDFTSPYYTSEHVLLVKITGPYANITSIDELSGARISGQIGTLYDDIAHAIPEVVKGNDKDNVPDIVTDIQSDIVDGTVLELPVAQGLQSQYPDLKMIQFAEGKGFKQLEEENEDGTLTLRDIVDTDRDVSIGIAKNRNELRDSINGILNNINEETRNQMMQDAVNRQSA